MEDRYELVYTLMSAWGYAPASIGKIEPVLDVFKIETEMGTKNLKWTRLPDNKLLFIVDALEYLSQHGFTGLRTPAPTKDGVPFLVREGQHYLLSDWIEGRQVDLGQSEQLMAACATLARFHRASRGYQPPAGTDGRPCWGRLLHAFNRRCQELADFPMQAEARGKHTQFDREIQVETKYYLDLATFARSLLTQSSYRHLAIEAMAAGSLCHGDVAARNFILTPSGEICLIDFDSLRQDLPLVDLWKLFRRTMKGFAWDVDLGLKMLEGYEQITPLTPQELEVLMALLSFPQKYWRLANRYYSDHYQLGEERLYRKLHKYTAQRLAHARFLRRLARFCRERGVRTAWPPPPFEASCAMERA